MFALAFLLVAAIVGGVYFTTKAYSSNRHKAVSFALRAAVVVLLFIPLLEPVLILPDVVPDENFVAVLIDASESMTIPDGRGGVTRINDAGNVVFADGAGIAGDLEEHFQVRYYLFDKTATRVDSVSNISPKGTGTSLSTALERVMSDFRGVPLSGIVLVTDGGDNSTGVPLNVAEELGVSDVPLHIVGVGSETLQNERELLDVRVSKAVEENTGAEIDVKVRSWNDESGPVTFSVYRGPTEVFSERRTLKGNGRIDQLSFFFEPAQPGAAEYRLMVAPAEGEINLANNEIELLIDTHTDTTRVLYFEGALRQDFKFIKRALEDDQVVDFISVSRTGTGKYYRQGVRNEQELAGGFPSTESDLFRYKAVVLGDIEASSFSLEQMTMLEKFVRVRGGGFLMLGGKNSFAEGGYWNTPVAELLPVNIDLSRRATIPFNFSRNDVTPIDQGFKFVPTAVGAENPILKFTSDSRTNAARWSGMPGLTSINFLGTVKPGAQVLATKPADSFGGEEPLLVSQRFGRGRSFALATSSTWRWQMLLDSDDQRHERFWRQLVRSLAASAPDAVNISIGDDHPEPEADIDITVSAFDDSFRPYENATVTGVVRDPFGTESPVMFDEELASSGTYGVTLNPTDEGVYELTVEVTGPDGVIGRDSEKYLVRRSRKEFSDTVLKKSFLQSLAAASNGEYYSVSDADVIPDRLRSRKTTTTVYTRDSLWDMPLLFLLIAGLLSYEWFYRRRKGLK